MRDAGHFSLDPEKDVSLGMVEDLNGDGRLDFVLNYRVNYLTVGQAWASKMFATTNDDTCYVEVYHGQGPEVSPETANGWRRLTVDLLIREWPNGSIGWGAVRMVIEFSGDRYEWQGVDRCTFPEEKTQLGPLEIASECNGVLGRAPQRGDTMFEFDAMDSH